MANSVKRKKRRPSAPMNDLTRLVESLEHSHEFSVHFCVCPSPTLRKKLLKELSQKLGQPVTDISLNGAPDAGHILLKKALGKDTPSILYISGLESAPSANGYADASLSRLNEALCELRVTGKTFLFLLPLEMVNRLRHSAPDLWEWRSGFYFIDEPLESKYGTAAYLSDFFFCPGSCETYAQKQELLNIYEILLLEQESLPPKAQPLFQFDLWGKLGRTHFLLGNFREAGEYFHRQVSLAETIRPRQLAVEVFNNLGLLHEAQGEFDLALEYLERAEDLADAHLRGSNHPCRAIVVSNKGEVHRRLGDFKEAFLNCRQAVRMCEAKLGMRHPVLVPLLIKFGRALRSQGELENALDQFRRALQIVEKKMALEHPYTAAILQEIGRTYQRQQRHELARRCFYRTLETIEKALGAEHPYIGMQLNQVGEILLESDDLERALPYFQWALEIRRQRVSGTDPVVGDIYYNMGRVYQREGKVAAARMAYGKALEIYKSRFPPRHHRIARAIHSIQQVEDALPRSSLS